MPLRLVTQRQVSLLLIVMLFFVTMGCQVFRAPTPVAPTRDMVTAPAVEPSPTPTRVPPSPTPEPPTDPCPAPAEDLEPPARSGGLVDDVAAIQAYLDQGGDVARVPLRDEETMQQGDLTGDGVPEIVFRLIDPESEQILPMSRLVVFTCRQGNIVSLYQYQPGEWFGLELLSITDMTEDGVADLVFAEINCGAHTCWHTPQVWSWRDDDFVEQIGAELSYPYPAFEIEDGKLVVTAEGIGSVGAGPQRVVTTTLAWNGDVITETQVTTAPPFFRYHALLDGDLALGEGQYAEAQALYEQVLDEETLETWGASSSQEEEHNGLRALTRWRLLTLHTLLDNLAEAEPHAQALAGAAAPSSMEEAVAVLAERFLRAYARDEDVNNACAYAVGTDEVYVILNFLNSFGYANPVYEISDLCLSPDL